MQGLVTVNAIFALLSTFADTMIMFNIYLNLKPWLFPHHRLSLPQCGERNRILSASRNLRIVESIEDRLVGTISLPKESLPYALGIGVRGIWGSSRSLVVIVTGMAATESYKLSCGKLAMTYLYDSPTNTYQTPGFIKTGQISVHNMGRSFLARSFALLTVLSGISNVAFASSSEALWPLQTYKSSSIKTPYLNVTKMGQTEPGYLFFTPQDIIRDKGHPTIYSDDGQLVWQGAEGNYSALQPQMLNGEPVIAYWTGYDGQGFGFGHISILNSSYDEIHRVTLDCKSENFVTVFEDMEFESCIDIHESQFTSNGTILVTAVNVTQADLSSVGGPIDGWIQDGLIYEIDLETNEILFRWSAHEHIDQVLLSDVRAPLEGSESGVNKTNPYGYPHLNAVYKYGDSYLLSSRYMCSVFFIDPNGDITWHLHVCIEIQRARYLLLVLHSNLIFTGSNGW